MPAGAVAGLLDPRQRSGWQLAQEVWQESGVVWELLDPESDAAGFPSLDPTETVPADLPPADGYSARARFSQSADPGLDDPAPAPAAPAPAPAAPAPADSGLAPADSGPARAESAATWFNGRGPADPRMAAARPVSDRPTVVERTRPSFADSGLVPDEPGYPSAAIPRRPTFTPADNARPPLRDRVRPESVRYDDVQGPPRPARGRPNRSRPEPIPEPIPEPSPEPSPEPIEDDDPEPEDRVWFGSDQPGRPFRPERPGRARRRAPGWNQYPASEFPGQSRSALSGQVPLGAPVAVATRPPDVATRGLAAPTGLAGFTDPAARTRTTGAAAPLGESDELFRAWQGSVREAASPRRPWAPSRTGTPRRRRALQVATVGVPAAIIVSVGAGALMMLTGKANEMLAPRSDTGAVSPTGPAATAAAATASAGRPANGTPAAFAGAALRGYPGQRGVVTVASMRVAGGVTVAVGAADGHPAIWRRAADGTWTLESAAALGAMAGRASLTSLAYGQAGWIAVGAVSDGGPVQPVVLASADGATWRPAAPLQALAVRGTQFLGVAAGHGGYVVVGRQMDSSRIFAVLWYSPDLRSWTLGSNGGLDGRLSASTVNGVAATAGGFVAVGSHGAVQAIWLSADGRHWNLVSLNLPSGAHSATLTTVSASGGRVVAAGYAATPAGDIPVVETSADGGAHWRQLVLPAPNGLGLVSALTATPRGFTAAGLAGKGRSVRAVTWTSPDGLTWSQPAQTTAGGITALTTAGPTVVGTAQQGANSTTVAFPAP